MILGRFGIYVSKKEFLEIFKKSNFSITHKGFQGAITKRQTYAIDRKNNKVIIAHMKGLEILNKKGLPYPKCIIKDTEEITIEEPYLLRPLPHQEKIFNYVNNMVYNEQAIKAGAGSCIIQLEAGLGKTFLAMRFILEWSRKTLVIVPTQTLVNQWAKDIKSQFPNMVVGKYYGKEKSDGQVIIACIQSLLKDEMKTYDGRIAHYTTWFDQFGACILDEIHMFCAKSRSKIFRRCKALRVLGMSATCHNRIDEMDAVAHHYLGKPIIINEKLKLKILEERKSFKLKVTKAIYNGPRSHTKVLTNSNGTTSFPLMINQLADDSYRNKLIIKKIAELYQEGHSLFVFLDRVELIKELIHQMNEIRYDLLEDTTAPEIEGIIGGVDEATKLRAKENARICLLTYGCGGTGLSFVRYTAAIFAHPRRNGFLQYNNRIFRLGGPKRERHIVYIVDNKTSLKSQYSGFKKAVKTEYPDTQYTNEIYSYMDFDDEPQIIEQPIEQKNNTVSNIKESPEEELKRLQELVRLKMDKIELDKKQKAQIEEEKAADIFNNLNQMVESWD